MLTIDSLIAVIGLVLTAFGLGYSIGCNHTKKNNRQSLRNLRLF